MSRAKTYDRTDALLKARDAFWQYGYDAIGVRGIEQLTGLNRFAIQTDFGGKQGLFLEALEKYAADAFEAIVRPLGEGDLSAIEDIFIEATTPRPNDPRNFGCLMVNTVVENAAHHREALKKRTDVHFQTLREAFQSALRNAKNQGDLAEDFDIASAASFLMALAMGMQVHIRMTGSVAAARQQADMALKILNCWRRQP